MLSLLGANVEVIKQGPLLGLKGKVKNVDPDGNKIAVEICDDVAVVMPIHDVQLLAPADPPPADPNRFTVQLPENTVIMAGGLALKTTICVVTVNAAQHRELEDSFRHEIPIVLVERNPQGSPDAFHQSGPQPAQPVRAQAPLPHVHLPFGPSPYDAPPYGYTGPGAYFPPPPFDAEQDEKYTRLAMARSLMLVFMQMRRHMLEATGLGEHNDVVEGDEWKLRILKDNAQIFKFSESETQLYESCCRVLNAFLAENPHTDPVDHQ